MMFKITPKEPTPDEVEKYIFKKWEKTFAALAEGPRESYPAYHEVKEEEIVGESFSG